MFASTIDPAGDAAYFAASNEAAIVKIRLSDFSCGPALSIAETMFSQGAAIDTGSGFAYFVGVSTVVKIRLSDFTQVSSLFLSTDVAEITSLAIDASGGFLYAAGGVQSFGGEPQVPHAVKVRLSDFSRVGKLELGSRNAASPTVTYPYVAMMDSIGGHLYLVQYQGTLLKIRLSDFTLADSLQLSGGENEIFSAVLDPAGYAYVATGANTDPGRIVAVRLEDLQRVDTLSLHGGEYYFRGAVRDTGTGALYFGGSNSIVKVEIGSAQGNNSLDRAFGFPSPFDYSAGHRNIRFSGLQPFTTVRVYTLGGQLVRELSTGSLGFIDWDVRNRSGEGIPPGTYVIRASRGSDHRSFKTMILRGP